MINSKRKVISAVERCFDNWLWRYKDYFSQVTMDEMRQLKADALALLRKHPEIVRCKDCTRKGQCQISGGFDGLNPDWFCADGGKAVSRK